MKAWIDVDEYSSWFKISCQSVIINAMDQSAFQIRLYQDGIALLYHCNFFWFTIDKQWL